MYNHWEAFAFRKSEGNLWILMRRLNGVLVNLFRDVMDLEEQAIITSEYRDITNNDMHVIEAVGLGEPKNMSAIAKALSVTVGTLTISMNSLVKERLCEPGAGKRRSPGSLYLPVREGEMCLPAS